MQDSVLFVLITGVALSYGWGMRGLLIGGEKGAILPGALLGLALSKFSGIPILSEHWVLFSAIAALGTSFGGFEPYAQTADFLLHKDSGYYNPKIAFAGIALKGANWFGICALVFGMAISVLSGKYALWEVILFWSLEPLVQLLGIRVFNSPYRPKVNHYPKLYFSRTSREEWGGNFLLLLSLFAWALIHKDVFSVLFGLVGILSGSVCWIIAYLVDDFTAKPMKNGKFFFGALQEKGYIDNWKIMEFGYGLLVGVVFAVFFILSRPLLVQKCDDLIRLEVWNPSGDKSSLFAWIAFALIMLTSIQYLFSGKVEDSHWFEVLERPLLIIIPLMLLYLGNEKMGEIILLPVLLWLAVEKNLFDRLENISHSRFIKIITALFYLAFCGLYISGIISFSIFSLLIISTLVYLFFDFVYVAFRPIPGVGFLNISRYKPVLLTYSCFIVQSVILIAVFCL